MLAFLMFAFGGIELIGMAAAEAKDPKKNHSKSNQPSCFPYIDFLYRFTNHFAFISAMEPVRSWWPRQKPIRHDF